MTLYRSTQTQLSCMRNLSDSAHNCYTVVIVHAILILCIQCVDNVHYWSQYSGGGQVKVLHQQRDWGDHSRRWTQL